MVEPLALTSGLLALLGESLLLAILVALARRARHLDDARPARLLWIAVPMIAIATAMRVTRYATGTFGAFDTMIQLPLAVGGWALAWRATTSLPRTGEAARRAGTILIATAAASLILQLPTGGRGWFPFIVQAGLGLSFGCIGATLATLGWRLRAEGESGLVPGLATLGGLLAALSPWIRALVILSAQAGDLTMAPLSRLVQASLLLLAALFAWPAADVVASLVERDARAAPP